MTILEEFQQRNFSCTLIDSATSLYQISNSQFTLFMNDGQTATSLDSYSGSIISLSKILTRKFLNTNQYPHTTQVYVDSISKLDAALKTIGHPCVLKPVSENNGLGVFCNIDSKSDLMFHLNSNSNVYLRGVLLEKHVIGDDYRITTLGNRYAFAIKRIPPTITGNGVDTIDTLIKKRNKILHELHLKNQVQKIIPIDTELKYNLKKANMSLSTVLEHGKQIRLKSISNLSVGGERIFIDEKSIHPDVIDMCESLSKKLGLFAAGIDYITQDITKSPEIGKDAILEINNNPQLGKQWSRMFVDRLLECYARL